MVKVFLVGIIETAKDGIETFDKILELKSEIEIKVQSLNSRSVTALKIIEYLYQKPIIPPHKAIEITGLSAPTAYKLLSELEEMQILKEITGGKRKKVYAFEKYLKLF